MELGPAPPFFSRSMVELLELGVFGWKNWIRVDFSDLELRGVVPNTLLVHSFALNF
jgi:hypothetical protein